MQELLEFLCAYPDYTLRMYAVENKADLEDIVKIQLRHNSLATDLCVTPDMLNELITLPSLLDAMRRKIESAKEVHNDI